MEDKDNQIMIEALTPGYDPKDLHVKISGDMLVVEGNLESTTMPPEIDHGETKLKEEILKLDNESGVSKKQISSCVILCC